MNRDIGRRHRRVLSQLANSAWDRERSVELTTLAASFDEWEAGLPSPQELSERIHTFHHGPARDLCALYTRVRPSQLVTAPSVTVLRTAVSVVR